MCTEIDLLEANNKAMQTAIHTELGGTFGSGNCDRNGCFARVGGPQAPKELRNAYGHGSRHSIDSSLPFGVSASVDSHGAMSIELEQHGQTVRTFDRQMAGKYDTRRLDLLRASD